MLPRPVPEAEPETRTHGHAVAAFRTGFQGEEEWEEQGRGRSPPSRWDSVRGPQSLVEGHSGSGSLHLRPRGSRPRAVRSMHKLGHR